MLEPIVIVTQREMLSQEKFGKWIGVVRETGQVRTCPERGIPAATYFPAGSPPKYHQR